MKVNDYISREEVISQLEYCLANFTDYKKALEEALDKVKHTRTISLPKRGDLMDSEKQYGYIKEEKLWESIKSGQGASHLNIPPQKSVPPMPKKYKEKYSWVSVKDRLPEVNKEVIVYLFSSNQPYIAWWNGNHWQTDEFCLDDYLDEEDEPIAWFPLPEPYKGDN